MSEEAKHTPTLDALARNVAVAIVDGMAGYTVEFAPFPAQHAQDYDTAERIAYRELDFAGYRELSTLRTRLAEVEKVACDAVMTAGVLNYEAEIIMIQEAIRKACTALSSIRGEDQ